jgi:hypothetical protein
MYFLVQHYCTLELCLCALEVACLCPNDLFLAQITLDLVNSIVWIYGSCKVGAVFHGLHSDWIYSRSGSIITRNIDLVLQHRIRGEINARTG